MPRHVKFLLVGASVAFLVVGIVAVQQVSPAAQSQPTAAGFDATITQNAQRMLDEGRQIFRYDTFGSEDFWGGKLRAARGHRRPKAGRRRPGGKSRRWR